MSVHVALVCRSPEVREALRAEVSRDTGLRLTCRTGLNAAVLAELLLKDAPDVVVVEVGEDASSEIAIVSDATPRAPGVPLVVVSTDHSADFLRRAMRAGARDVVHPPLDLALLRRLVAEHGSAAQGRAVDHQGDVHAFYPVKGGSGATFLSTNLAHALAQQGQRVLLIDLELHFGEAASYVSDQAPKANVLDLARQVQRLDLALLSSSVIDAGEGLHLLPAPFLPYDVADVTPAALDSLLALARMAYDHVLIDLGADLSPLTVHALELADRITLPLPPLLPALQNLKHVISVLRELRVSENKLAIVLNRMGKSAAIRPEEVQRVCELPVARLIPSSPDLVDAAINQGVPLARIAPKDPVVKAIEDWAVELAPGTGAEEPAGRRGWLSKLTGRSA